MGQLSSRAVEYAAVAAMIGCCLVPAMRGASAQTLDPATGHAYMVVSAPGIEWPSAVQGAASMTFLGASGYLATLTTQHEVDFIANYVPEARQKNVWLGGYQDVLLPTYSEPSGGWRWITGEAWDFTYWAGGEPNNNGAENYLHIYGQIYGNHWNDLTSPPSIGTAVGGYLVEFGGPGCLGPWSFAVDPSGTFLHTNQDAQAPPLVVDLEGLGVFPGQTIRLYRFGSCESTVPTSQTISVLDCAFSASDVLGPSADLQRVVDAIGIGDDFATPPTQNGGQATEIPEDFGVANEREVQVPDGAKFLIVGVYDDHFDDNIDVDRDLRLAIAPLCPLAVDIIESTSRPAFGFRVWPNPVQRDVNLVLGASAGERVELSLFDLAGRRLGVWEQTASFDGPNAFQIAGVSELCSETSQMMVLRARVGSREAVTKVVLVKR